MKKALEQSSEAKELFLEAAGEDGEAARFLMLWSSYCHSLDDLVDGDIAPTALKFIECNNLLTRLLTCEFFTSHRNNILVLKCLIGESFLASEELRRGEGREKDWGLFLSHSGNDMVRFVALVTGGESKLNSISRKLRALTLKEHYGKH